MTSGSSSRVAVILGTDHKNQRGTITDERDRVSVAAFRDLLKSIVSRHQISAIAEEMSVEGLRRLGQEVSVAQQICEELTIHHQFSDPCLEERVRHHISGSNAVIADHLFDGWTPEQIEADIQARGDPARERYWWSQIEKMDVWPLLFICGASHSQSFAKLLISKEVALVDFYPDWEPLR